MITRRTKIQLVVFAIITALGVSFVGARYAQLDRVFVDRSYSVTVDLEDSGGAFSGGLVAYRGVKIGQVGELELTQDGVRAELVIENTYDDIRPTRKAVVGNRSALGEQYIELQPQDRLEPYLADGAEIPSDRTSTPLRWRRCWEHLDHGVVGRQRRPADRGRRARRRLPGHRPGLQQIIDTGNSFIETADENFATTANLIGNTKHGAHHQLDNEGNIRSFARDLSLFSGTLADSDADLRARDRHGQRTAKQLRTFLEDNRVELGRLVDNLVTTGEVVVRRLPNLRQFLVLLPVRRVRQPYGRLARPEGRAEGRPPSARPHSADPPVCTQGYPVRGQPARPNTQRGDIRWTSRRAARCRRRRATSAASRNNPPRVVPFDSRPHRGGLRRGHGSLTWGEDADAGRPEAPRGARGHRGRRWSGCSCSR